MPESTTQPDSGREIAQQGNTFHSLGRGTQSYATVRLPVGEGFAQEIAQENAM